MNILVLGTGGFDNEGLPFNSFLIDDHILIECPPDILVSLGRESRNPLAIDTIYLSHTHGDHIFGLPFLLFAFWKRELKAPRLIGPSDLREKLSTAAALAIRPGHPFSAWAESLPMDQAGVAGPPGALAPIGGYVPEFYRSYHDRETWGLGLRRGGELAFQYIPDTRWDPGLLETLGKGASLLLADVNGTGGVRTVHMAREELEEGIAGLAPELRPRLTLGTHLSRALDTEPGSIDTVRPGMRIRLGMDKKAWLARELSAYSLRHPEEAETSAAIASFAASREDSFLRSSLEGHVTGSAFVVNSELEQVLLVHHRKLDRWLQPGGHCEKGEAVFEAAVREIREETGLEARPLLGGSIFDVDIHPFPAKEGRPAHFHYDIRFLFAASPGEEQVSEESHDLDWFSLDEARSLSSERSVHRPLLKIAELAKGRGGR